MVGMPPAFLARDPAPRRASFRGDHVPGQTPTHADFFAFDTLESHREIVPSCLDGHGSLQRFLDDVRALPPIADDLARRRPSDFQWT